MTIQNYLFIENYVALIFLYLPTFLVLKAEIF